MKIEDIAKVCHEANKALCESCGDYSQVSWDDAPEWQKQSAFNGVMFNTENPDHNPEQSHLNWMREKREDGWVYGEVKDAEKKEHPCMVAYHELPKEQQIKDHLFKSICNTLSEMLGDDDEDIS